MYLCSDDGSLHHKAATTTSDAASRKIVQRLAEDIFVVASDWFSQIC